MKQQLPPMPAMLQLNLLFQLCTTFGIFSSGLINYGAQCWLVGQTVKPAACPGALNTLALRDALGCAALKCGPLPLSICHRCIANPQAPPTRPGAGACR